MQNYKKIFGFPNYIAENIHILHVLPLYVYYIGHPKDDADIV